MLELRHDEAEDFVPPGGDTVKIPEQLANDPSYSAHLLNNVFSAVIANVGYLFDSFEEDPATLNHGDLLQARFDVIDAAKRALTYIYHLEKRFGDEIETIPAFKNFLFTLKFHLDDVLHMRTAEDSEWLSVCQRLKDYYTSQIESFAGGGIHPALLELKSVKVHGDDNL